MNKINQTWTKDGFVLRLAQVEEAEVYVWN